MGFTNDTQMAFYIPPTMFHRVVGTWTEAAGAVTDTIALHKAATAETAVVTVPVMVPSNLASALKGALLKSVCVDFELLLAVAVTITPVLHKVTRGIEGAVGVVSTVATTYLPAQATLVTQDQHKLVVTITTPEWVDQNTYYLLELTMECGDTVTIDMLAAVANFTLRQ